jgi:transposase
MKKKYDKEFKIMISELMLSGQSAKSLSEEYGVDASTIRNWKNLYQSNKEAFTGSGNPSLTLEEKEIRRLKKQLREAEMERDILKKAVGIFSMSDRKRTDS